MDEVVWLDPMVELEDWPCIVLELDVVEATLDGVGVELAVLDNVINNPVVPETLEVAFLDDIEVNRENVEEELLERAEVASVEAFDDSVVLIETGEDSIERLTVVEKSEATL